MWIYLLLLASIGASSALQENPEFLERLLYQQSDADAVTRRFMGRVYDAVNSRRAGSFSGFFADQFVYEDCKKNYTKENVVEFLSQLPENGLNMYILKSADFISTEMIRFTVTLGFATFRQDATFVLSATYKKLQSGHNEGCSKPEIVLDMENQQPEELSVDPARPRFKRD